jgi:hypothetical protein
MAGKFKSTRTCLPDYPETDLQPNQQIAMQADWILESIMLGYITGIRSVYGSARGCAKSIDYNTYNQGSMEN